MEFFLLGSFPLSPLSRRGQNPQRSVDANEGVSSDQEKNGQPAPSEGLCDFAPTPVHSILWGEIVVNVIISIEVEASLF